MPPPPKSDNFDGVLLHNDWRSDDRQPAQRPGRRGKRGPSAHHRSIVQGSDGLTINGGTYANGDASTINQYNLIVVNFNNSPSLTVSVPNAVALVGLFGYPGTTGM